MAVDKPKVVSEFWAGVVAALPEEKRGQAQEILGAITGTPAALDIAANGVLRQSDYSRQMNELAKKEAELTQWHGALTEWKAEQDAIYAAAALKPDVQPQPQPQPKPAQPALDPARYVDRETFDQFSREAAGVMAVSNALSVRHLQEFGEALDLLALMKDPRLGKDGMGLKEVYEATFADRYAAKAQATKEKELADLRAKIESEVRAQILSTPYPVSPNQPSSLDLIEAAQKAGDGKTDVVGAATALYEQLQQKRLSGGGT